MQNLESRQRRVIRIPLKKVLVVVSVVIGFVAVWAFINLSVPGFGFQNSQMQNMPNLPDLPVRTTQTDITDTREFLKIRYSGTIQTRNVSDTVREVRNTIRSYEGRIDEEEISPKIGQIRFVVAKSVFEAFRSEIESTTHKKLYSESISSENRLASKQEIEEKMDIATSSLEDLMIQKVNLDTQHTQILNAIQSELTSVQAQYATVKENMKYIEDEERLASMEATQITLSEKIRSIQNSLSNENSRYVRESQNLKNAVESAESTIENVEAQDENFTNNIETVNGYITVHWIGLWGLAKVFSPLHPTVVSILLILLMWVYLSRKGYTPRFEFV